MEEGRISPQESLSGLPVRLDVELAPDLGEIGRLIEALEGLSFSYCYEQGRNRVTLLKRIDSLPA